MTKRRRRLTAIPVSLQGNLLKNGTMHLLARTRAKIFAALLSFLIATARPIKNG
jgi:hypothetical protein